MLHRLSDRGHLVRPERASRRAIQKVTDTVIAPLWVARYHQQWQVLSSTFMKAHDAAGN